MIDNIVVLEGLVFSTDSIPMGTNNLPFSQRLILIFL